jgi:hypothetical protein
MFLLFIDVFLLFVSVLNQLHPISIPDGQRRGERFADACVLERDRFGGGSVMVWEGYLTG